jgi:hypothetical protein
MPKQLFELARLLPSHATHGQVPVYNSNTKTWGAGNVDLDAIEPSDGTTDQVITHNGTKWVAGSVDLDAIKASDGSNGQVIKHNGTKWEAGTDNDTVYTVPAFASWTATLTTDGVGADPNIGSTGSAAGSYVSHGKLTVAILNITFNGAGVAAGSGTYISTIPVDLSADPIIGSGFIYDSSLGNVYLAAALVFDASHVSFVAETGNFVSNSSPFTWAAGDQIAIKLVYKTV